MEWFARRKRSGYRRCTTARMPQHRTTPHATARNATRSKETAL